MKCLIFDPYYGADESMIVAALLGCGADEWRVASAIEGLLGARVSITEDREKGVRKAVIDEVSSSLSGEEALGKLNLMHEKEPVRSDSMSIVKKILGVRKEITLSSVAMIAGICAAYDSLGRPYVQSTPVATGGGSIDNIPLPRKETLELLKDSKMILQGGPFDGELLTVGAAAVFSHYVSYSGRYYPENKVISVGYGAGQLELPLPHVLRAMICEADDALIGDRIELLETNVDDVTGEVLGNLIEELLSMGARDVSILPATMKKGRSGQLIRVVAKAEDGPAISRRIMLETGTLGVRVIPVKHRYIAKRDIKTIKVSIDGHPYHMRFKVAADMIDNILDVSVEYEDAKMVAKELAIPLKTVMRKAETEAWKHFDA